VTDASSVSPRYRIEQIDSMLRICISKQREPAEIVLMGIVFSAMAINKINIIRFIVQDIRLAEDHSIPWTPTPFYALIIVIFVIAAIVCILSLQELLWVLKGQQVIEVTEDAIAVAHRVPGFQRTHTCRAGALTGLRVSPISKPLTRYFSTQEGPLVFDYDGKPHGFGSLWTEAEAYQIITAIQQRFPQYCKDI
jgi:hypothetical protein